MIDLLVRRVRLTPAARAAAGEYLSGDGLVDMHVDGGRFARLAPHGGGAPPARTVIDAAGALASPPYVEPHVHLDTCLTAGQPRWNRTGTLWEGIACWAERKPSLTAAS